MTASRYGLQTHQGTSTLRAPFVMLRGAPLLLAVLACTASLATRAAAQIYEDYDWLRLRRAPNAESCLEESELAKRIARQMGRSPVEAARRAHVRLIAIIEPRNSAVGWNAVMRVVEWDGKMLAERSIEQDDPSCEAAVDALAVVGALLLDEKSPSEEIEQSPRRASLQLTLAASAMMQTGLLPSDPFGAGLSAMGRFGLGPTVYLRLEFWPDHAYAQGMPSRHAIRTSFAQIGLGACLATPWSGVYPEVGVCLGFGGGVLRAESDGFVKSMPATLGTASFMGSLSLQQPLLGRILLRASVRAEIPFVRDQIAYETTAGTTAQGFRASPVGAVGELGIGYRFP